MGRKALSKDWNEMASASGNPSLNSHGTDDKSVSRDTSSWKKKKKRSVEGPEKEVVVAKCNYNPKKSYQLRVCKGDELELLPKREKSLRLVRHLKTQEEGYIPCHCFVPITSSEAKRASTSSEEAENKHPTSSAGARIDSASDIIGIDDLFTCALDVTKELSQSQGSDEANTQDTTDLQDMSQSSSETSNSLTESQSVESSSVGKTGTPKEQKRISSKESRNPVMKAKQDYQPPTSFGLNVCLGEEFEILAKLGERWWPARRLTTQEVGYIPVTLLSPIQLTDKGGSREKIQTSKNPVMVAIEHNPDRELYKFQYKRGDQLEILAEIDENWWLARHLVTLDEGYVPKSDASLNNFHKTERPNKTHTHSHMNVAEPAYTDVYLRFIKLSSMMRKVAPRPLRLVLRNEASEKYEQQSFSDFFCKNKKVINLLSEEEEEKLKNSVSAENFDITLLYKCIRHGNAKLTKTNVDWKAEKGGRNLESLVTRVKKLRNDIAHNEPKYTEHEFMDKTEDLRELLVSIYTMAAKHYNIKTDDEINEVNRMLDTYRDNNVTAEDLVDFRFERQCERVKTLGKENVKEQYQRRDEILVTTVNHIIDISLPVDDIYTDMKLKESECGGKTITFQNILDGISNSSGDPVILLEGDTGAGKTTLVKKILSEWISGRNVMKGLGHFDLVLYNECRNVTINTFDSLLNERMPGIAMDFKKDELKRAALKQKIMIILDGLDEINDSSIKLFQEVLELKKNHGLTVLITSRPEKLEYFNSTIKNLHLKKKHIVVIGIPQDKREAFVKRYHSKIADVEKSTKDENLPPTEELLEYLKRTKYRLENLWRLPYNLTLLTILFISKLITLDEITTAPELYREIYRLYRTKLKDRLRNFKETKYLQESEIDWIIDIYLHALTKESARGLMKDQINLPQEAYQRLESVCSYIKVPVEHMISAFLRRLPAASSHILYTFPHKGLQDYLAAHYVWMLLSGEYQSHEIHKIMDEFCSKLKHSVPPYICLNIMAAVEKQLKYSCYRNIQGKRQKSNAENELQDVRALNNVCHCMTKAITKDTNKWFTRTSPESDGSSSKRPRNKKIKEGEAITNNVQLTQTMNMRTSGQSQHCQGAVSQIEVQPLARECTVIRDILQGIYNECSHTVLGKSSHASSRNYQNDDSGVYTESDKDFKTQTQCDGNAQTKMQPYVEINNASNSKVKNKLNIETNNEFNTASNCESDVENNRKSEAECNRLAVDHTASDGECGVELPNVHEQKLNFDIHKFQNMLLCLLGMFYSQGNNVQEEIKLEVLRLLQNTGIRNRDAWLSILNSVKCDNFVASFIAKQEGILIADTLEIDDGTLYPYLSLMKALESPPDQAQLVKIELKIQEEFSECNRLLKEIDKLRLTVSKVFITDSNLSHYAKSLQILRRLLTDKHEISIRIKKSSPIITEFLHQLNHHNFEVQILSLGVYFRNFSADTRSQRAVTDMLRRCSWIREYQGFYWKGMLIPETVSRLKVSINKEDDFNDLVTYLASNTRLDLASICLFPSMRTSRLRSLPLIRNMNGVDVSYHIFISDVTSCNKSSAVQILKAIHPIGGANSSFSSVYFPRLNLTLQDAEKFLIEIGRNQVRVQDCIFFPSYFSKALSEDEKQWLTQTSCRENGCHVLGESDLNDW